MVYVFLMGMAFLGLAVYAVLVFSESPEIARARLGELEPLPDHLGKWQEETDSPEAEAARERALKREVRILHEEGGMFGGGTLLFQARLRDDAGAIVEVEPEQRRKRQRRFSGKGG